MFESARRLGSVLLLSLVAETSTITTASTSRFRLRFPGEDGDNHQGRAYDVEKGEDHPTNVNSGRVGTPEGKKIVVPRGTTGITGKRDEEHARQDKEPEQESYDLCPSGQIELIPFVMRIHVLSSACVLHA